MFVLNLYTLNPVQNTSFCLYLTYFIKTPNFFIYFFFGWSTEIFLLKCSSCFVKIYQPKQPNKLLILFKCKANLAYAFSQPFSCLRLTSKKFTHLWSSQGPGACKMNRPLISKYSGCLTYLCAHVNVPSLIRYQKTRNTTEENITKTWQYL